MTSRRILAAASLLAVVALAGCSSTAMEDQRREILMDQTPGMATLNQTWDDNTNTFFRVSNTNLHAAAADFNRFFLLDRPSRLTREPQR